MLVAGEICPLEEPIKQPPHKRPKLDTNVEKELDTDSRKVLISKTVLSLNNAIAP